MSLLENNPVFYVIPAHNYRHQLKGQHVFVFQALSGAQGGILGDSEAGINNEVDHTAGATLKPFLLKACLNSTAGTIC